MATIEPRLMHLLNGDSSSSKLGSNYLPPPGLPPIKTFGGFANPPNWLPPLEPDAGLRGEKSVQKTQQIPPLHSITDDSQSREYARHDGDYLKDRPRQSGSSLRMLLDNPEINESSHSLSHILDDTPDTKEDASTKKRHRALTVKDEFVQLPQPLKKQKSSQQVVPPIINGLHEPPPDAAVFPPISSGSFDDNETISLNLLKDFATVDDRGGSGSGTPVEAEKTATGKTKRKAAKPRRKWTEQETNDLLRGVGKHGVGKWTSILDDRAFTFNDRNAGDLKDRFRTCCPDELRSTPSSKNLSAEKSATTAAPEQKAKAKTKTALLLEDILADPEDPPDKGKATTPQQDSDAAPKQRKSRAHRKKLEDLQNLGIHGPFKKSHRRERRPFTEQDDNEILDGLSQYGPAWTKIQRDPRFNLRSRQPTDLRDRVRNKYPDTYARIEKGNFQIKEPGRGNNLLEPSVNTTIENSLNSSKPGPLDPQLNRTNSKEDMPKWPLPPSFLGTVDAMPSAQTFDMNEQSEPSTYLGSVEQMDISRLLLD